MGGGERWRYGYVCVTANAMPACLRLPCEMQERMDQVHRSLETKMKAKRSQP
jgi:hypothetical protein